MIAKELPRGDIVTARLLHCCWPFSIFCLSFIEHYYFIQIFKMGPKKAAPAKKKDNTPENGGELTPEDRAKLFMLTCQSLQVQLGKVKKVVL